MIKKYKFISSIIIILMVFTLLPLNNSYVFANSEYDSGLDKNDYYQKLNSYTNHYEQVLTQYESLEPEFSNDINSYNIKLKNYNTCLLQYNNKTKEEQTIEEYNSLLEFYNQLVEEYSILKNKIAPLLNKYDEIDSLRSEYNEVLSLYQQHKEANIEKILPDINYMNTLSTKDICFFIGDGKKTRWQLYVQAKGWPESTGGGMGNMRSYFYEFSINDNILTFSYPEKSIAETISFVPKAGYYTLQVPAELKDTYDNLLSVGNTLFLSNDIDDLEAGIKWLDIWFDEDAYIRKPTRFLSPSNPNIQRPVAPVEPEIQDDKLLNICFSYYVSGNLESAGTVNTDFGFVVKNYENDNIISCYVKENETLNLNNLSVGSYIIEKSYDNHLYDFQINILNSVEGVKFERCDDYYILTISEDISSGSFLNINIKGTFDDNKIIETFYSKKYEKTNLFILE